MIEERKRKTEDGRRKTEDDGNRAKLRKYQINS